jgi:uncharacterized protein (DUF2141 family)
VRATHSNPRSRRLFGRLRTWSGAAVLLAFAASPILADPIGPATARNLLSVQVVGLRNDHGQVCCTLFPPSSLFPAGHDPAQRTAWAPITDRMATCEFHGLAPGVYAVVVFHDENSDGIFNRNWLGMPKEGYGFSNDAPARWRAPKFDEASFPYAGGEATIRISIRYGLRR